MDQLSQRDQMQVMQALNEMQMQAVGVSGLLKSPALNQRGNDCNHLTRILSFPGNDEYLQQFGGEVLQRMRHKFSYQGQGSFGRGFVVCFIGMSQPFSGLAML